MITVTQISNPPEPAMDHDSLKLMILLPFIAIYFRSFRYETPCTIVCEVMYDSLIYNEPEVNKVDEV